MDQSLRNKLRNVVTHCRRQLEQAISDMLQGQYGIHASGEIEDAARLMHLSAEEQQYRGRVVTHLDHILHSGLKPKDAAAQLVREAAFTHLNRLCAYKMMATRGLILDPVGKVLKSRGFLFYLADHPDDEQLWSSNEQETAYRHYLEWLNGTLSEEIGVLFSPHDVASGLFPPHRVLVSVLESLNSEELQAIWNEDETIGWVYQYFTPKELRDQARKESAAPRNSYEMAFRNQFFTPRYVVEFLVDNTLGRTWYEMRRGDTALKDKCRYLSGGRWSVVGGQKEVSDDGSELSAASGVAESNGVGQSDLHSDKELAARGNVRTDEPDSARSSVNPVEHSRGTRTPLNTGIPSSPEHSLRLADGSGNANLDSTATELSGTSTSGIAVQPDSAHRTPSQRADELTGRKEATDHRPPTTDHRLKKDPREIKVLDPACGSGHFLLYCFDLLQEIYEEAYTEQWSVVGGQLSEGKSEGAIVEELKQIGYDYSKSDHRPLTTDHRSFEEFKRAIPGLILAHNLHGIDIDLRVTQLAALALWLRAQRTFQEMGLKENRPQIERMNLVCAEPMPGEEDLLEEFIAGLSPHVLGSLIGELVRNVFTRMKLAGEAGALVRIEDDIIGPIEEARRQWQEMLRKQAERDEEMARKGALFDYHKEEAQQKFIFDIADITSEKVWQDAEAQALEALREYARRASNGKGLARRLFAEDAEQGFAFIDLCRQKFDVVLMNPPFGDASLPSKPYIDETYGDTKGDVYKAFVECFQDRLVSGGFLGIISSRTGFFLSQSSDWRERIVLRLYRPMVLADFGMGVLDAMVETAAYVLRSLTKEEDEQLTLQLARELPQIPTDKKGIFSTKKYEETRDLKRHQANGELIRLHNVGFIKPIEGRFPRWSLVSRGQGSGVRGRGSVAESDEQPTIDYPPLVCLRLLGEEDKGRALYEALHNEQDERRFVVSPEDFRQVPNTPFCYWVSNDIQRLFVAMPPLESEKRTVKQGLTTADDFRFLRLWWEVDAEALCPPSAHPEQRDGAYCVLNNYKWFSFGKGGEYSPYYADLYLVLNWAQDGKELKAWAEGLYGGQHWSRIIKNTDYFFRKGLTWSRRSQLGLSIRAFPRDCIFSDKGPAILDANQLSMNYLLGLCNSKVFQIFVSLQMVFGSFEVGVLQRTPTPDCDGFEDEQLGGLALGSVRLKQSFDTTNEISHVFHIPALLQSNGGTLAERIAAWQARVTEAERQLAAHQREIDDIAFRLYGISDDDRQSIESSVTQNAPTADEGEQDEDDETEPDQPTTDHRPLITALISYAVGCAFGRWDARFATGEQPAPELPDPFAPLPVCAPGALTGDDGLPLGKTPEGYPLRVDWDGILVDDPDHEDDIIRRVREVFELMWQERAEEIEHEACESLGVKTLRDYFRKPTAGGFWTDHIKRYSKSRRKAPIYWLLQSSKKSYSLWLYYHRLDRDILFKALINYVEPKIRLEETGLQEARSKRAAGATGREAREFDRQIEKQEALISELHDFHDRVRRAATLRLEPDLNDGVVLNIAPLWEVVPWAEAKKYWKELLEGKYEWSTVSQQLRERKLVEG